MKGLIQRVTEAEVTVDGKTISKIGKGLCILLGIKTSDTQQDLEYVCRKVLNLRLFEKNGQAWKSSVMDSGLEVLIVSQFTLYAKLKGNKPDFHEAMKSSLSEPMYEAFLKLAAKTYSKEKIKGGKFGAMMQVNIKNDGPVTVEVFSDDVKHAVPKSARSAATRQPNKIQKSKSSAAAFVENSATPKRDGTEANKHGRKESVKPASIGGADVLFRRMNPWG
mmetsp:Transcript_18644/g.45747  ORF Transcript_18644/g.45747 Transcript_18644/m.45747 type:complete len:221 (-) Transcript_18644:49-711(-)